MRRRCCAPLGRIRTCVDIGRHGLITRNDCLTLRPVLVGTMPQRWLGLRRRTGGDPKRRKTWWRNKQWGRTDVRPHCENQITTLTWSGLRSGAGAHSGSGGAEGVSSVRTECLHRTDANRSDQSDEEGVLNERRTALRADLRGNPSCDEFEICDHFTVSSCCTRYLRVVGIAVWLMLSLRIIECDVLSPKSRHRGAFRTVVNATFGL